ncbi:hypothetical protein CRV00_10955 [Malaciobacter molluscorum]|uniref:hypothetical protein n=1 Tax=Malaciobacter molluscorum TaxID=1032072 RepID=UPI00100BFB34|nr:hypothetical protein [Malaciobacter molluscorum]RXJ93441.1 hypothetical protein CRV00_10955 [Malaciobacter molluscorum]
MDVSSINSNISNLNSLQHQELSRSSNTSKIAPISDEALSLNISVSYNLKRDELSNSLQSFNEGIAISELAKNGINKQVNILSNIQDKLQNKKIEDKNELKDEISNDLKEFTSVALNTKFKKETILSIEENYYKENNESFQIETKEANIQINKINTALISNDLANNLQKSDLNNETQFNNFVESVNNNKKYLQNLSDNFKQTSIQIQENAKDVIVKQHELSANNQTNNINFGKEANDFSKNNVISNMGYLAASQANIVQEQSIRLLS